MNKVNAFLMIVKLLNVFIKNIASWAEILKLNLRIFARNKILQL